jgi:hypothetical protein
MIVLTFIYKEFPPLVSVFTNVKYCNAKENDKVLTPFQKFPR